MPLLFFWTVENFLQQRNHVITRPDSGRTPQKTMTPALAAANATSFAFWALIKVYDDAIDNHWGLAQGTLQLMRISMLIMYFFVAFLSVEMRILLGLAAVFMLATDKVIGDPSKPHNLDTPFFYWFAVLVVIVFLSFCALRPSLVRASLSSSTFVKVLAVVMAACLVDLVLTPEECSAKKALSRSIAIAGAVAVLVYVDVFHHEDERWTRMQPIMWSALGYNIVWFATHWRLLFGRPEDGLLNTSSFPQPNETV
jgi:hypothetical protein